MTATLSFALSPCVSTQHCVGGGGPCCRKEIALTALMLGSFSMGSSVTHHSAITSAGVKEACSLARGFSAPPFIFVYICIYVYICTHIYSLCSSISRESFFKMPGRSNSWLFCCTWPEKTNQNDPQALWVPLGLFFLTILHRKGSPLLKFKHSQCQHVCWSSTCVPSLASLALAHWELLRVSHLHILLVFNRINQCSDTMVKSPKLMIFMFLGITGWNLQFSNALCNSCMFTIS